MSQQEERKRKQSDDDGVAKLPPKADDGGGGSSDSSSDDDEDDDLILEGALIRNPDVSDSDDTSSEESEDEEEAGDDKDRNGKKRKSASLTAKGSSKRSDDGGGDKATKEEEEKGADPDNSLSTKKQKRRGESQQHSKTEKKQHKSSGPEIVQVEFTFCDMDEKYFHGLKTLLTATSPIYAANSSALSDLMIENISVGTVVSTEGDVDGNVFGFASVLNVTTYQSHDCIKALKKLCLDKCPEERKTELQTVLSGKTKRPAGFMLHGRMVNMPLEVVEILHQQLVLDMDWAVENADGGEEERKSLDFGAFVRIAPTYRMAQSVAYKFFDDEIFAQHAEFTYEVELPRTFGMEETPYCSVVVMTKTGHRAAMKEIATMINGATKTSSDT